MTSCAMNASTANSSAICTKRALSWKAGVSNITSVVRTARLAIAPRASMPGAGRTGLMGAARPQTPRRSPRQAFGGNSSRPQGGKQTKTKTLRNPQNFSYEVSHLRVHARGVRRNLTNMTQHKYTELVLRRTTKQGSTVHVLRLHAECWSLILLHCYTHQCYGTNLYYQPKNIL